eukprot:5689827-Prymnesium_polylepis.1
MTLVSAAVAVAVAVAVAAAVEAIGQPGQRQKTALWHSSTALWRSSQRPHSGAVCVCCTGMCTSLLRQEPGQLCDQIAAERTGFRRKVV